MTALSSFLASIFWMVLILGLLNKFSRKKNNNWSRTPRSSAEQQAERIRAAAEQSSSRTEAPNPAFRMPPAASKGASRTRFANDVDSYSSTDVSGLDRSLAKDRGRKSLRDLTAFFGEDRKNDWMARQLREEARIKRMGSGTDLGAAHDADCDAAELKAEHRKVHLDAVDSGEPGRILKMQQKKRGY